MKQLPQTSINKCTCNNKQLEKEVSIGSQTRVTITVADTGFFGGGGFILSYVYEKCVKFLRAMSTFC